MNGQLEDDVFKKTTTKLRFRLNQLEEIFARINDVLRFEILSARNFYVYSHKNDWIRYVFSFLVHLNKNLLEEMVFI